ncbi:FhaA domain-containing protein, partial [Streptomyces avermitilis]
MSAPATSCRSSRADRRPQVFKSEVQPVEIAGALQRECDNNAT